MEGQAKPNLWARLQRVVLGAERSPRDPQVFRSLALIALFAWVGMGADGISSVCYGPPEAFKALSLTVQGRTEYVPHLALIVGLATAVTVLVISASYAQIIERFPGGGGGYLVASKLLSPEAGMVSGCALLLDYVLTIAISIAAATSALLSVLPGALHGLKLPIAVVLLLLLTLVNLRGLRESLLPLLPVFVAFLATHLAVVVGAVVLKVQNFGGFMQATADDMGRSATELGALGTVFLLLRAYSLGAGTYTGIEAVSNGLAQLREPRVATGKRTMRYMAGSLAVMALGLMLAYVLFDMAGALADPGVAAAVGAETRTLNAVLFDRFAAGWGEPWSRGFVWLALGSEAAILLVAAQAGFFAGPRTASNMALDGWFPHRFALLSDRLVTHNGVLLMCLAALAALLLTGGRVEFLIVLYSINVFITFVLTQTGMVRYWWLSRRDQPRWWRGLVVNGLGLALCSLILVATVVIKFAHGGWLTLALTAALVGVVWLIRRHYQNTSKLLRRLDGLVRAAEAPPPAGSAPPAPPQPAGPDPAAKTAVILVNGFNGLGLHTLFAVVRLFPNVFRNFVFLSVGVVDVGNFKGVAEVDRLREHTEAELGRYVRYCRREGFHAEAMSVVGTDIVDEVAQLVPRILERFPNAIFFGGQLVFPRETLLTRLLHNNTVFAIQRCLYGLGVPVIVMPVRV